jgi:uroporphyrinogen III methyltransferase/synthase
MKKGIVYLVGAGPGDVGLITVKGLECVKQADVILYDRLVDKRLLSHAHPKAELIYVGKSTDNHSSSQKEINRLLIQKAGKYGKVVRLKGGDPYLFGRGGEEVEILIEHGIKFEIVPGVSALTAVPAYAGIPITHRDYASSLSVITGHGKDGKLSSRIKWDKIATGADTLVIFMGLENLKDIVKKLVRYGRSKNTPIALIRRGTTSHQKTIVGTLETIVPLARENALTPPVIAVIGDVVKLRETLRWFDKKPLFGKRILVTRAKDQAGSLSGLLEAEGAEVVEAPFIKIEPLSNYKELDSVISKIRNYDWLIFTSVNGVQAFFNRLNEPKILKGIKIAAIGPNTAEEIRRRGLKVDYVPKRFVAEAVVEGFPDKKLKGKKILLPRAQGAREILPEELIRLGAKVDEVVAYRTLQPKNEGLQLKKAIKNNEIAIITFCSSSAVKNFRKIAEKNGLSAKKVLNDFIVACIGPITADTVRRMGKEPEIIAQEYTIKGLLDSIISFSPAVK